MNWDFEIAFKNAENYEKQWDSPTQNVFENARLSYYTRPFGRKAVLFFHRPKIITVTFVQPQNVG